jgi:S1-C subfamily serine protease
VSQAGGEIGSISEIPGCAYRVDSERSHGWARRHGTGPPAYITRGWLGVSIQPLTPELAKSFGLKDPKGVLIADVVKDSPADKAGLVSGDVLTEFDGRKLDAPQDLQKIVPSS